MNDFVGATGLKRRPAVVVSSALYHPHRPDLVVGGTHHANGAGYDAPGLPGAQTNKDLESRPLDKF